MLNIRLAVVVLALISLTFVLPLWSYVPTGIGPLLTIGFATFWFGMNVFVWLFPPLRRTLIDRRGPLLGFGFAFAAATVLGLVSLVLSHVTWSQAVVQWMQRFFWLVLPFIYPYVRALPRQMHGYDLVALAYFFLVVRLPLFTDVWAIPAWYNTDGCSAVTVLCLTFETIGTPSLLLVALFATYFFGVRWWSEIVLDIRLRAGDGRRALQTAATAIAGFFVASWLARGFMGFTAGNGINDLMLFKPGNAGVGFEALKWLHMVFFGVALAIPFQEVVFRGVTLPAVKSIPRHVKKWAITKGGEPLWTLLAAVVAATLHVGFGVYGLYSVAGFGFSLGVGISTLWTNRFIPIVIGHSIAWLSLALWRLVTMLMQVN